MTLHQERRDPKQHFVDPFGYVDLYASYVSCRKKMKSDQGAVWECKRVLWHAGPHSHCALGSPTQTYGIWYTES